MANNDLDSLPIPKELKLETYSKRPQEAEFDRLDLVLELQAGVDGVGAVVKSFRDAIRSHDEAVKLIEDHMAVVEDVKRVYKKKNRLFRNLDAAWNVMLDSGSDFYEYIELLPKMKQVEKRLELTTDPIAKATLLTECERYKVLHPVCSNQLIIYNSYSKAREERDAALRDLVDAESVMYQFRESEKAKAAQISDDHVNADEAKTSLSAVFPSIHVGMVLSVINGENVEHSLYKDILQKLKKMKSPHKAEFLRYDYRFDPFLQQWRTMEDLRENGVCVEDPMLERMNFIRMVAAGDEKGIKAALLQGEDPESTDYTGCSALTVAASNRHGEVVQILYEAGANLDFRDSNMMTPLLYSCHRGYVDIVRQLLDLGADKSCRDTNKRGVMYYSTLSGNQSLLKLFITSTNCHETEEVWGFTPLHMAASKGNLEMVKFLSEFGCSIYKRDKSGRTPEELAIECGHKEVASILQEERLNAPGQLSFLDDAKGIAIYLGDQSALKGDWIGEVEVNEVVYISGDGKLPSHGLWLKNDEETGYLMVTADTEEDLRSSSSSWDALSETFPELLNHILELLKRENVNLLIADEEGDSVSPTVLSVVLLLRYQMSVKESLLLCEESRPSVRVSTSLRRGLENLQRLQDEKKIKRMNKKLRNSNVISSTF